MKLDTQPTSKSFHNSTDKHLALSLIKMARSTTRLSVLAEAIVDKVWPTVSREVSRHPSIIHPYSYNQRVDK